MTLSTITLLSAIILIIGAAPSQDPRNALGFVLGYEDGAETGTFSCPVDDPSGPTLRWRIIGGGTVTLPLPFNRPGGAAYLGGRLFIVSGMDVDESTTPPTQGPGQLLLVSLDLNPNQITIVASQSYVGADFLVLYFNSAEDVLYACDHAQPAIVAGQVVGSSLPPAFVVAADNNQIEGVEAVKLKPTPLSSGVRVISYLGMWAEPQYCYDVSYSGSSWSVTKVTDSLGPVAWAFHGMYQNARGPSVKIAGAVGTFSLIEVDGPVIATGTTTNTDPYDVPVTGLIPGGSYYLRNDSGIAMDSSRLTFNSFWGVKCGSADYYWQRDLVHTLYVGNQSFAVTGGILRRNLSLGSAPKQPAYLLIGYSTLSNENVTVDPTTNCASIDSVSAIVGPINVGLGDSGQGAAVASFPVPNDSSSEGLHVIFQWASFVDGNDEMMFSEVFGSEIFASPFAGLALKGSSGGGDGPTSTEEMVRQWVRGSSDLRWDEEKRNVLRRMNRLGYPGTLRR